MLYVNIPADGLEAAVITSTELTEEEYRANTEAYLDRYLGDEVKGCVDRMLFNICYGRSMTDSDCFDSVAWDIIRLPDGSAEKRTAPLQKETEMLSRFRPLLLRGIDPFVTAIAYTREKGAGAWLSLRMNDHHFSKDPGFNSTMRLNHPEFCVDENPGVYNYACPEVRKYWLDYISELAEKYAPDGIEMDFLRTMSILPEGTDCSLMTGWVGEVRAALNAAEKRAGHTIGLSVRLYPEEKQNIEFGVDAAEWAALGYIESIVPEGWFIPTWYDIPVNEWKASVAAKNKAGHQVTVLAGSDWAVKCDSRENICRQMWITPSQLRGFAASAYQRGADGVYLFNHFGPDDVSGGTYFALENGEKIKKQGLAEKLRTCASEDGALSMPRSFVKTCRDYSNDVYPMHVDKNGRQVTLNTGAKTSSVYRLALGVETEAEAGSLRITLGGYPLPYEGRLAPAADFTECEAFFGVTIAEHLSEAAPFMAMFRVPEEALRDGDNTFTLISQSGASVLWISAETD